jgi:hypothetical protein
MAAPLILLLASLAVGGSSGAPMSVRRRQVSLRCRQLSLGSAARWSTSGMIAYQEMRPVHLAAAAKP